MATEGIKQQLATQLAALKTDIDQQGPALETADYVKALAAAIIAEELGRLNQHLDTLCVIASDRAVAR